MINRKEFSIIFCAKKYMEKLENKYNPKDFEDKIYERWEKSGYFKPNMDKTKNIATRQSYGEALVELGKEKKDKKGKD